MNSYWEIKKILRERRISLKSLAEQFDCSQNHLSQVISGNSVSARVQLAIARALRRPVRELFPDYKTRRK